MSVIHVPLGADLRAAVTNAPDGATLSLAGGTFEAGFALERSITLQAAATATGTSDDSDDGQVEVILRPGPDGGPVLWVDADGIAVQLHDLRLTDGVGEVGGGISLRGFSTLELVRCEVDSCRASQGPGDAVWVDAGTLTLRDCHLRGLVEREAAVVVVTGVADLHLRGGTLVGHGTEVLRLRDGCEADIAGVSLRNGSGRAALSVAGTRTRAPVVKVTGARLRGTPSLNLKAAYPGKVSVGDSVLASPAAGVFRPLGGVVIRDN